MVRALQNNMALGEWVPETGLVLDVNPTVVNVFVDILFLIICAGVVWVGNRFQVALRKRAMIRTDGRHLPLGRFDMLEVVREWFLVRSGPTNSKVYGLVIVVSGFVYLAHLIADSGLEFKNYPMGPSINCTRHYMREGRGDIVFKRSGHPGGWKYIATETDVLEYSTSDIQNMDLYLKSLTMPAILENVIGKDPEENGTAKYPGVIQTYDNGNRLENKRGEEISVSWWTANWFSDSLDKSAIFLIPGETSKENVTFYSTNYEVRSEVLSQKNYSPKECIIEKLGSVIAGTNPICLLCRKQVNPKVHNYLGVILFCEENRIGLEGEASIFSGCNRKLNKYTIITEVEEVVSEGKLSPIPLPVLGSLIGMLGIRREPGQSYRGAFLNAVGAARFYSARQQIVMEKKEIPRPVIKLGLIAVVGTLILLFIIIFLWEKLIMVYVERRDPHVAAAHLPSRSIEWAFKAFNERLRWWASGKPKPREVCVGPFLGVVHKVGETDDLEITIDPQPPRRKPLG